MVSRDWWGAEDELVRWHHWLTGHEFEQTLEDSGGQRNLFFDVLQSMVSQSQTWLSNWTTTTTSLSIPLSVDTYIASMSWLLQIVLQWTLGCVYFFELWFSPDVCPGVWLLDHMETVFSFLRNFLTVLHSGCSNLHCHQQGRGVPFSPPLTSICYL